MTKRNCTRKDFPGFKDKHLWTKKSNILCGPYIGGGFIRWYGEVDGKDKFLVGLQKRPAKPDEFYRTETVLGAPEDARDVLDLYFEQWMKGEIICEKNWIAPVDNMAPRLALAFSAELSLEPINWSDVAGMPPLSGLVHAKYTGEVDTSITPWILQTGPSERQVVAVYVGLMVEQGEAAVSQAIMHSILLYLENRLERVVGGTVALDVAGFQALFARLRRDNMQIDAPGDLSVQLIETLALQQPRPSSLKSTVVTWYGWCVENSFDGFEKKNLRRLKDITLPPEAVGMRGVRSNHPTKGALSFAEEMRLQEALKNLSNRANLFDRIVVWLLYELGVRSSALLHLRSCDLKGTLGGKWRIRIRRVKQRKRRKAAYFERSLSPELGEILSLLPGNEEYLIPGKRFGRDWASKACKRFVTDVSLTSPRIVRSGAEQPLRLFPSRLRYSLATRLAEIGCSPETIADMLDDETLTMALVYTENTSELVEVLGETVDKHPAFRHHIGLFKGEVNGTPEKKLPMIPGGVPHLSGADVGIIGHCSNPQPCTLQPPLACYRCPFLLAMPDPGVHQRQFEQLTANVREQVGRESDRMAKVFQPDMYAIAEVITQTRGGPTLMQRLGVSISQGMV